MTGPLCRAAATSAALVMLAAALTACDEKAIEPAKDDSTIRQEIQQLTENLYWIHLRLDTAMTTLDQAEQSLVDGNTSAAAFHVDEARRALEKADGRVLEVGQGLQQAFGLDRKLDRY